MVLLFVKQLFGSPVIQALCWTLLHSFWQGLLLAIVAGIVILLTRKSGPAVRYNLLSGLLFLFVLCAALTFSVQLRSAGESVSASKAVFSGGKLEPGVTNRDMVTVGQAPGLSGIPGVQQQFMSGLVKYFNDHAYLVVIIWFIIFSVRLVRIMAHFGTVQRIRNYRTHSPSIYWRERLEELAGVLKIRTKVFLLESEIVRVPMVTGFFRPLILVPFSLLSQLPPEQVEAVLLHELAHIKRGDFFINIAQHFTEILFFFNPGVLWISSLIREERENCCDDIAVRHTGSKKEFIHALVSFQEFNNGGLQPAMAFAGSRDHLLQRVKRIVYNDNKILDIREKFFLLGCLLVTVVLSLAFSYLPRPVGASPVQKKTPVVAVRDTLVKPDTAIVPATETTTRILKNAAAGGQDASAGLDSAPGQEEKRERIRRQREELLERQRKLVEEQERLREEQEKLEEEEMKLSGADKEPGRDDKEPGFARREEDRLILLEKIKRMEQDMRLKESHQPMTQKEKIMEENNRHLLEQKMKEMQKSVNEIDEFDRGIMEDQKDILDNARKNYEENLTMMKKKMEFAREADKRALNGQLKTWDANRKKMTENQARMKENQARVQDDQKELAENLERIQNDIRAQNDVRVQNDARIQNDTRVQNDQSSLEEDRAKMALDQMKENAARMENQQKVLMLNRKAMEANRAKTEENRQRMEMDRVIREKRINDLKEKFLNPLVEFLYDKKIISDKENFTLSLTANALTVNGVKQPDALFRTVGEKYGTKQEDDLTYSRQDGSVSLSMKRRN